MGILFVMKTYRGRNELWMRRMIEALEDDIAIIAAKDPEELFWKNRIPVIPLDVSARSAIRGVGKKLCFPGWALPLTKASAALYKAVSEKSVDKVMCHFLDYAIRFSDVWEMTEKPLFVHCHGYDVSWELCSHHPPFDRRFDESYLDAVRDLSQRAILIANSETTKSRLLQIGISDERIRVKYFGIPASDQPLNRPEKTTEVNILYLGRLIDCKGPDLTIRAFEIACDRGFDGHLTMAGDGPLRMTCELLRRRSRYSNRIELLGAVSPETGMKLRYQADIFAAHNCIGPLSHQEEAFGVSVVEAMADKLPVVTGKTSALCETVIDGETGFLFEPGDMSAQADVFVQLANSPSLRKKLGTAGYQRVQQHFSIEHERNQLRNILGLEPQGEVCASL